MNAMYILWAIPYGVKADRLYEQPLTSMALTNAQADSVQATATADGWHSFRRSLDTNEVPDFVTPVTDSSPAER